MSSSESSYVDVNVWCSAGSEMRCENKSFELDSWSEKNRMRELWVIFRPVQIPMVRNINSLFIMCYADVDFSKETRTHGHSDLAFAQPDLMSGSEPGYTGASNAVQSHLRSGE